MLFLSKSVSILSIINCIFGIIFKTFINNLENLMRGAIYLELKGHSGFFICFRGSPKKLEVRRAFGYPTRKNLNSKKPNPTRPDPEFRVSGRVFSWFESPIYHPSWYHRNHAFMILVQNPWTYFPNFGCPSIEDLFEFKDRNMKRHFCAQCRNKFLRHCQ